MDAGALADAQLVEARSDLRHEQRHLFERPYLQIVATRPVTLSDFVFEIVLVMLSLPALNSYGKKRVITVVQ